MFFTSLRLCFPPVSNRRPNHRYLSTMEYTASTPSANSGRVTCSSFHDDGCTFTVYLIMRVYYCSGDLWLLWTVLLPPRYPTVITMRYSVNATEVVNQWLKQHVNHLLTLVYWCIECIGMSGVTVWVPTCFYIYSTLWEPAGLRDVWGIIH